MHVRFPQPALTASAAAIVALTLILVGCAEPDKDPAEAFCTEAGSRNGAQLLDVQNVEDIEEMNAFVDEAPEELRESVVDLRDLAEEFSRIRDEEPKAVDEAIALFETPGIIRAVKEVAIFLVDECRLDVPGIEQVRNLDPDDPDALTRNFEDSTTTAPTGPAPSG